MTYKFENCDLHKVQPDQVSEDSCGEDTPLLYLWQGVYTQAISGRHTKVHLYSKIPQYKSGEALLQCTSAAKAVSSKEDKTAVDPIWQDVLTAVKKAKRLGKELWCANIVLSFGK